MREIFIFHFTFNGDGSLTNRKMLPWLASLLFGEHKKTSDEEKVEELRRDLAAMRLEKAEETARAERLAKSAFFDRLQGMSSSSSAESSSGADMSRRGAPEPVEVPLHHLLPELAPQATAAAASAWAEGCKGARTLRLPTPLPAAPRETTHLQPILHPLLLAATPPHLRLWWERRVAADDVPRAEAKPDFLFTHLRDAQPSLLGAVALLVVKQRGCLAQARAQACAYMRRRMYKLVCESDERCEDLSSICLWGLATDMDSLVLLRMHSGAPHAPGSFEHCTPCPVQASPPLQLLSWDWMASPRPPLTAPLPAGFAALVHALANPCSAQCAWELPLVEVEVEGLEVVGGGDSSGGGGGGGGTAAPTSGSLRIVLPQRLGSGGSCDVYSVAPRAELLQGLEGLVLKLPRACTLSTRKALLQERAVLQRLRSAGEAGLVPLCVAQGVRASALQQHHHQQSAPWPLLLLRPVGVPLVQWMAEQVEAAQAAETAEKDEAGGAFSSSSSSSSGDGSAAGGACDEGSLLRQLCATRVALRVAQALRAAHALRIVHCDVRPSNIVVVGEKAVLVDWGLARAVGEGAAAVGVTAFCEDRVWIGGGYTACPAQDALALLYTWLALASDCAGAAPWQRGSVSGVLRERDRWLAARWEGGGAVQRVVRAIAALSSTGRAPADPLGVAVQALEGGRGK
jgi:hypothetical protein